MCLYAGRERIAANGQVAELVDANPQGETSMADWEIALSYILCPLVQVRVLP